MYCIGILRKELASVAYVMRQKIKVSLGILTQSTVPRENFLMPKLVSHDDLSLGWKLRMLMVMLDTPW
jgi:hypothetical protein